ncbi:MAG: hypothetical protein JSW50_02130 [Candidatus Latescibacterota bacterium]|nr:MAG: hypothetical protein JSW50_02130 [Candidatus Latescibacterota bacterium]
MKHVLIMTLALLLAASVAMAQESNDRIGLYATPTPAGDADCNITDAPPGGLLAVYCVHLQEPSGGPTMIASQFQAVIPECFTGSWLSDTAVYPVTVNNSQVGVAIGYGICVPLPSHVLTINLFALGDTPPCCIYPVTADPNIPSGRVEFVDCDDNLLFGWGQSGVINGDQSCECSTFVATEHSTWGKVKALYQ